MALAEDALRVLKGAIERQRAAREATQKVAQDIAAQQKQQNETEQSTKVTQ